MRKRILFLIPNLKPGGAEKVLVNLVNNLDPTKYDITVQTIFDIGIHRDSLKPHIRYRTVFKRDFRGNNQLFQLFSPEFLWKRMVKEHYDIAISYLEGPTNRIVSGCCDPDTKRVAWLHTAMDTPKVFSIGFRSPKEAAARYPRFHRVVAVSQKAKEHFQSHLTAPCTVDVLYNTNETEQIQQKAQLPIENPRFPQEGLTVCSTGKLIPLKGFDRLMSVHKRLLEEGIRHKVCILGIGEEQKALERQIQQLGVQDSFLLLGYQTNPYQYVANSDLYVCASTREGFSTAVTEALVVGTPVVSTDVSGARELLGERDEYGLVVENSEDGIYQGMKRMLSDPALLAHYKEKAKERGSFFSRTETVKAVEAMLDAL